LFGRVNPSGKLPLTFSARLEDDPSFGYLNVDDGEKVQLPAYLVHPVLISMISFDTLRQGYKHYQRRSIIPRFAFGCVDFTLVFIANDLTDMACPTIFGSRSVRNKHKRE